MKSVSLCLISCLALSSGCQESKTGQVNIEKVERFSLSDGIEQTKVHVRRGTRSIGILHSVYAEVEKTELKLSLNPEQKAISGYSPKALLVTNAGFFTEAWKPTGFLKSESKKIAPFVPSGGPAGSGLILLAENKIGLHERSKTKKSQLDAASFGIQAGPRIIENSGKAGIRSDDGKQRNRTLIGSDKRGRLVIASFISHTDWSDGVSLFELQKIISEVTLADKGHKDLSLSFALNLDGGPSTGFHLRHSRNPVNASESTPVHSILSLQVRP